MEPGHKIEHFVVIEKIGQGGQAAVWSAYDERLRRTVAIKTIDLKAFEDASASTTGTKPANISTLTNPDRFREEAQIIAALEHPNILPVYAFGQEGDMLYIVMRYMPSGTLKDVLKHEPLSASRAAEILEPLAGALDLAHHHNIIHRDIKSANILLDAQMHPFLADFGLSMSKERATAEAGVGTLAYMSPEQMMGDPVDHRSDLYSFGILLYELLTGSLPMHNNQAWNLHQAMSNVPMPMPDFIPPMVANVLRRATAIMPDERYQSAKDIVVALREATSDIDIIEIEPEITDPAMLALREAQDLFDRAQERWADGAGRFRFEAGDYKYVHSYYNDAESWNLIVTDVDRRLLLRAALEHGFALELWWDQVKDVDDRRAVVLQTLTSDLSPARRRAMEYLALVPDSTPPAIPIRVATVIVEESDPAVQMEGIRLLEKRAPSYGQRQKHWESVVYNNTIDSVLAYLAMTAKSPAVADMAARTLARMRSTYGVSEIAKHANKDKNAFNALVAIRDEVGALPPIVSGDVRQRVFLALSWRQLTSDILGLILRYASAAIACAVMIGAWAYWQFDDQGGLLAAQRVGNALAAGALYGALTGFGIFAAVELASRLRAWHPVARALLGLVAGSILTAGAFDFQVRYFRFYTPEWQPILLASIVFVAGFALASAFTRRATIRSLVGAAGVMLAVYFSMKWSYEPLLYLMEGVEDADAQNMIFSSGVGIAVGLLTFLPEWIAGLWRMRQMTNAAEIATQEKIQAPTP